MALFLAVRIFEQCLWYNKYSVNLSKGEMALKTVHVVVALIIDQDKVFATQRGYGEFKDGWEFPGGKIEPGETPEQAIKREIQEELATEIRVEQPLTTVEYDYPTFHLSMQCFICKVERGKLTLLEHEAARWLSYDELDTVDWLPADQIVVRDFRKYLVKNRVGLVTTLKEFREEITREGFTTACHDFVEKTCGCPVGDANDRSWADCYDFFKKYLPADEGLDAFSMAFEYMMPDSQKRADVLLFSRNKVIILEFKQKGKILKEDIAQAGGYRQSISHYHFETEKEGMQVDTHLVYTHEDPKGDHTLVDILNPSNFTSTIRNALKGEVPMSPQECFTWVNSPFHPLKNIADATLQLFQEGDLPNIKTIREGDIKNTLDAINAVIDDEAISKSIIFVVNCKLNLNTHNQETHSIA